MAPKSDRTRLKNVFSQSIDSRVFRVIVSDFHQLLKSSNLQHAREASVSQ